MGPVDLSNGHLLDTFSNATLDVSNVNEFHDIGNCCSVDLVQSLDNFLETDSPDEFQLNHKCDMYKTNSPDVLDACSFSQYFDTTQDPSSKDTLENILTESPCSYTTVVDDLDQPVSPDDTARTCVEEECPIDDNCSYSSSSFLHLLSNENITVRRKRRYS